MSDFTTREQLRGGYRPRYLSVTVPSGRVYWLQSLPEGPLAELDAFRMSWQCLDGERQRQQFDRINREGTRRILQATLVEGEGGPRMYGDGDAELAAIAAEIDGADAAKLYEAAVPFVGLTSPSQTEVQVESLVKNLLTEIVGGSR